MKHRGDVIKTLVGDSWSIGSIGKVYDRGLDNGSMVLAMNVGVYAMQNGLVRSFRKPCVTLELYAVLSAIRELRSSMRPARRWAIHRC